MSIKILSIVESRAGWLKSAILREAVERLNSTLPNGSLTHILVHTAEAYEATGHGTYFNDLELPKPDLFLGIPTARPLEQSAKIIERFSHVLMEKQPTVVLLVGDANSTLDCALATKRISCAADARKSRGPILAHVEAGLRSFDRGSLREVNGKVTDLLSDYLFTTEESANRNLLQEGVSPDKIYFVGSLAVDTLLRHRGRRRVSSIVSDLQLNNDSGVKPFALATLQHLFEQDAAPRLAAVSEAFFHIAQKMPVVFPAPPEVGRCIQSNGLGDFFIDHFLDGPEPWDARVRIRLIPPLGYLDFIRLMEVAKVVLTDSAGVQEEARMLGVPCITLAEHTSRTVTLEGGANILAGTDADRIKAAFSKATRGEYPHGEFPRGWDGLAAQRIVDILWNDFHYKAACAGTDAVAVNEKHAGLATALASDGNVNRS